MVQGKLARRQIAQTFSTRDSEGVVVGVVRSRSGRGVGIHMDFTDAPVPDRRYSADAAWVVFGSDMVRVLLAQYKAAGPEIEHLVVVRLSFEAVKMFLSSMDRVSENATAFLARVNSTESPPVDKKSIPNQTFTLDANIVIAGFSGREACIDLYYSSPQVKVALGRGSSELRAEPVARVMLATRLMMDIHDELKSKQDTLPSDESETEFEEEK